MPWFAWIAIIAILVWGVLMVIGMATGRPLPGSGPEADELESLKKRLQALEAGQAQGQGQPGPGLERRIERLEARMEKRELRAEAQEDWERRAKDMGLDGGPDDGSSGPAGPSGSTGPSGPRG